MTARPFRLVPPELPERELQENVIRVLDALIVPPTFVFSAAIGAAKLTAQQAAALSRAGVKRGLPDILCLHNGVLRGIELKKPGTGPRGGGGGVLSKTRIVRTKRGSPRILEGQEDVFPRLEAAGMEIKIARSVGEVIALLTAWGVPLRGASGRDRVDALPLVWLAHLGQREVPGVRHLSVAAMIDTGRLFAAGSLVALPPRNRWHWRGPLMIIGCSLLAWGLMALAVLGGLTMPFTPL